MKNATNSQNTLKLLCLTSITLEYILVVNSLSPLVFKRVFARSLGYENKVLSQNSSKLSQADIS